MWYALAAVAVALTAPRLLERLRPIPSSSYDVKLCSSSGTTIPVITIHNSPRTANVEGVGVVLREACEDPRVRTRLPSHRLTRVLIAQPGLGAKVAREEAHFARTAANAGCDLVLQADMTDQFLWPWESADLRMVRIDESVSHRFEHLVVAARRFWGRGPDAILESQSTRLIAPGAVGSVTVSDLYGKHKTAPDFKLGKVVVVGVPLPGMKLDGHFRKRCIGEILALSTPSKTGFVVSEPLIGEPKVELRLRNGSTVAHRCLFEDRWPDGQENPVPDLAAMFLKGFSPAAIQREADRRRKAP